MRPYLKPHEAAELDALLASNSVKLDLEKAPEWTDEYGNECKFHDDQLVAWFSTAIIIAICAGWQSGKTIFLAWWLLREIQRRGTGDYGAFSTTYKLMDRKFLPELKKVFGKFATFHEKSMQFRFTELGSRLVHGPDWNGLPTIIQLGYADTPDSLESATMKAVVWDEPGQKLVPEESYQTVQSRLMMNRGRMVLASRPYEFNWFERLVTETLLGVKKNCVVVNFPSWANPFNPPESDTEFWDEKRREMADWQFIMKYLGKFTRPAGAIYDCEFTIIDDKDSPIEPSWQRFLGMDFGLINVAGVFLAKDPNSRKCYVYRSYCPGKAKTTGEHVLALRKGEPRELNAKGGNHNTEHHARNDFTQCGLPIAQPIITGPGSVEGQMDHLYAAIKNGDLVFLRNGAAKVIEELTHISWELDDDDNPIPGKIKDEPKYHRHRALGYVVPSAVKRFAPGGRAANRFRDNRKTEEDD